MSGDRLVIQVTPEERHWLEDEWSRTSKTLVGLLLPLTVDLIDGLDRDKGITDDEWRRFLHRCVAEIDRRREASRGGARSTMYGTTISLFADSEPLRKALSEALARLIDDDEHYYLLRRCLKRGLVVMRYRLTSDSEHRARTWSRLDRMSRQLHQSRVAAGQERLGDSRCNDQHIAALHELALAQSSAVDDAEDEEAVDASSGDRDQARASTKLPRKIKTIRGYFEEFCPDCDVREDLDAIDPNDIDLLPDHDRKIDYLEECIDRLDDPLKEALLGLHRIGPVVDIDIKSTCLRIGIDRFRLARRAEKARALLRICLEDKIERELI